MIHKLPNFDYFYFIRHGRTEANVHQLMAGGNTDIPLNETGHQQAMQAAQLLKAKCPDIQTICVSSMTRAKQTADYINRELQRNILEMPELVEWRFGEWEGKKWDDVAHQFLTDGEPPNGESRLVFRTRILTGLQNALVQPGPVLVVAHGGVWYKIQRIFNLPLIKTDNCQVFKIYSQKNKDLVQYSYHEITLCP